MRPHIHPRGRLALLFLATALEITRINHSYVFHGEREREREVSSWPRDGPPVFILRPPFATGRREEKRKRERERLVLFSRPEAFEFPRK